MPWSHNDNYDTYGYPDSADSGRKQSLVQFELEDCLRKALRPRPKEIAACRYCDMPIGMWRYAELTEKDGALMLSAAVIEVTATGVNIQNCFDGAIKYCSSRKQAEIAEWMAES